MSPSKVFIAAMFLQSAICANVGRKRELNSEVENEFLTSSLADHNPALTLASPQGVELVRVSGLGGEQYGGLKCKEWEKVLSLIEGKMGEEPVPTDELALAATTATAQAARRARHQAAHTFATPTVPLITDRYSSLQQGLQYEEGGVDNSDYLEKLYEEEEKREEEAGSAGSYKFGYRVSDPSAGTEFGQSEERQGRYAKGSYHVLLPDGRLQTVHYYSDDTGFHARVSYDGVAHHYH